MPGVCRCSAAVRVRVIRRLTAAAGPVTGGDVSGSGDESTYFALPTDSPLPPSPPRLPSLAQPREAEGQVDAKPPKLTVAAASSPQRTAADAIDGAAAGSGDDDDGGGGGGGSGSGHGRAGVGARARAPSPGPPAASTRVAPPALIRRRSTTARPDDQGGALCGPTARAAESLYGDFETVDWVTNCGERDQECGDQLAAHCNTVGDGDCCVLKWVLAERPGVAVAAPVAAAGPASAARDRRAGAAPQTAARAHGDVVLVIYDSDAALDEGVVANLRTYGKVAHITRPFSGYGSKWSALREFVAEGMVQPNDILVVMDGRDVLANTFSRKEFETRVRGLLQGPQQKVVSARPWFPWPAPCGRRGSDVDRGLLQGWYPPPHTHTHTHTVLCGRPRSTMRTRTHTCLMVGR